MPVGELIGMGGAALSAPNRGYRRALKKEIGAMESGQLGLTAAETEQMQTQARGNAAVNQAIQNAALTQMVQQNPALGGKALQAQGQIAETGALASSQAGALAMQESRRLAEARKAALMDRLYAQSTQNLATGEKVGGYAEQAVPQIGLAASRLATFGAV